MTTPYNHTFFPKIEWCIPLWRNDEDFQASAMAQH